jgi:translation initiation factor 3 subunit B
MAGASPVNSIDLDQLCGSERDLKPYAEQELQRVRAELDREGYKNPPPKFELVWTNYVVLAGLPIVGLEKAEKLKLVLGKIISKLRVDLETSCIDMPMHEGQTTSCAFLTCPSEDVAKQVILGCSGLQFDKQHRLAACSFSEFDRLMSVPEIYEEPRVFRKADLMSWLLDPAGRDQFVIRHDALTEVFWNDPAGHQPDLTPSNVSAERYVAWSGSGIYLASLNSYGVVLWAGNTFQEVKRFPHSQVSHIEFSPCDRYLLTFSSSKQGSETVQIFSIWDVFSGQELRSFRTANEDWGIFKWSPSGNYLARISEGAISVYHSEDMQLLTDSTGNKTSIKLAGVKSFMWSPSTDILSFFLSGETGRMKLMEIPSRREIYTKSLTQTGNCSLHWQSEGKFLAALNSKTNKVGKVVETNVEIFFVTKRDIPACLLQIGRVVTHFAWKSRGTHFSLIVKMEHDFELRIYQLNLEIAEAELIAQLETQASEVCWAPTGGHFVLCNRAKGLVPPGQLEFFAVKGRSIHTLNSHFHSGLTHVEWDPAGLHVISSTRQALIAGGSGNTSSYAIWTCQGQSIHSATLKSLYQLVWRPRPKDILPAEKATEVQARAAQQASSYLEADRARAEAKKQQEQAAKNRKWELLAEHMRPYQERWRSSEAQRSALVGFTDSQDAARWRTTQTEVETILKTKLMKVS